MQRPAPHFLLRLLVLPLALAACQGEHQGPGTPSDAPLALSAPVSRAPASSAPQGTILFGDLHVHTTFSMDAFITSLPMMGGEGVHPPADACDYARFCAGLDFWSINDHAESISPRHWQETREAIRACNAVGGDGAAGPVAFLGWEWSQVGSTPDTHFGHKNVIFRETGDDETPARPIAAPRPEFGMELPRLARWLLPLRFFGERRRYYDYFHYLEELRGLRHCPAADDTRELPPDCHETAKDPAQLFAKLRQWGFPSLVIPHGTGWGLMAPPGSSWDLQRPAGQRDPRQSLVELYSGHGSSEEVRAFRAVEAADTDTPVCPEPTLDYEPCCWRAGEIVRARCEDPGSEDCEARVRKARADHAASGVAANRSVPGASVEDWGDCGQCRDCFLPAFNVRPGMSVQYALASGDFRFGVIGSSDTHAARAGNGFKEHARRQLTEARAPIGEFSRRLTRDRREPTATSERVDVGTLPLAARRYVERGNSMLLTGGLAAVHAPRRERGAIWDALERREVYATSGPRILLWFDLLNAPDGPLPMGGESTGMREAPRFRVRALGPFEQQTGCPQAVVDALPAERIASLCLGECYHPSDRRMAITRIEVVRIRPGAADLPIEARVEDPWQIMACPADGNGCEIEFEDASFSETGGEVAYYVRAIQEPTLAVNGAGLRCQELDENGSCLVVEPCYGDERTDLEDDCPEDVEERAWSSPIFVAP